VNESTSNAPRGPRELSRHPLFLLLLGSLIGSVLIPWLNTRADRQRLLREARLKAASEIIRHNLDMNQKLNTLQTTLELFHKNNASSVIPVSERSHERAALRIRFDSAYLDFDQFAWWWYRDIYRDAVLLGIADKQKLKIISTALEAYTRNLSDSAGTVYSFAYQCFGPGYDPADQGLTTRMGATRRRLTDLAFEREKLISQITHQFDPTTD
jgi:hypothetical protein